MTKLRTNVKKIKITRQEFDTIINNGVIRKHTEFKNNNRLMSICRKLKTFVKI